MSQKLPFKISTNLKNIIGKDLINDKYIAVFELVKNSYDAGANNVSIEFINGKQAAIIIKDDGCGMSYDDIINKWLFVAYSEKKEVNLKKKDKDYRDKLKRQFAGAKGVGRFSCDRLGSFLKIITSTENSNLEHIISIDWSKFEEDDEQEFVNIAVEYDCNQKKSSIKGTTLIITGLRETWDRDAILSLKKSLMKLVNPKDNSFEDKFNIFLIAKDELLEDSKVEYENNKNGINDFSYSIVNGEIINDIFSKLEIKTTSIEVNISEDGTKIATCLYDRGIFVFKYTEKNVKFDELKNINSKIFYMNRAAKFNFTRQMGTEPVNYGSIFVYKNSFRVYPYGEPGRDFFDIDRRKAQGYNRYFGTREIMGQIKIIGDNNYFYETTSRDGGFIRNTAVEQLEMFFKERILRVLEKYVVDGIQWGDPDRELFKIGTNEQGLMPYDVKDAIIKQFSNIHSRSTIIESEINHDFINNEELLPQSSFDQKLTVLRNIAKNKDKAESMLNIADDLQKEAAKIRARQQEAEVEHQKSQEELLRAEHEIATRAAQNEANVKKINKNILFLEDGHHLIYKYAKEISGCLSIIIKKIKNDKNTLILIDSIDLLNKRIIELSNLATKGDYDFKGRKPADLIVCIKNLIFNHPMSKRINCNIIGDYKIISNFAPTDIAVIIDNILDNAYKATAKNLEINVYQKINYIYMVFKDDGNGLSKDILKPDSIFEVSYSKTNGTGLGLSHVKTIAEENDGDVRYIPTEKGFCLQVRIKYECRFPNTMV